jgi:hypothetical protein
MQLEHAYTTLVTDGGTGLAASVGTISLEALGDEDLADLIRFGRGARFLDQLRDLPDEDGDLRLEAVLVDEGDSVALTPQQFPGRVAAVIGRGDSLQAAVEAWHRPFVTREALDFAIGLLESTVLAEHSEAAAMAAAGAVGAAFAGAVGSVFVAPVSAGQFGLVILIASPAGIVLVGAGAAYLTWRLLRSKRSRPKQR